MPIVIMPVSPATAGGGGGRGGVPVTVGLAAPAGAAAAVTATAAATRAAVPVVSGGSGGRSPLIVSLFFLLAVAMGGTLAPALVLAFVLVFFFVVRAHRLPHARPLQDGVPARRGRGGGEGEEEGIYRIIVGDA